MATFKALNIESDSEPDDEVDNSKEIQIEEALKLYQVALKFHSEGPGSFDKATDAYKALFESEIFKYPESQSEFRRIELQQESNGYQKVFHDEFAEYEVQARGVADQAPNTLPQILHLSFKNYGQLLLDQAQERLRGTENGKASPDGLRVALKDPVHNFAEALGKDGTDFDLWRQTSSVAQILGSQRIARFCLEAMFDGDEEGLQAITRFGRLEEWYACQRLREVVRDIGDDIALGRTLRSPYESMKLSADLMGRLNPSAFNFDGPAPSIEISAQSVLGRTPRKTLIDLSSPTWVAVGNAILQQVLSERDGPLPLHSGPGLGIKTPENWQLRVKGPDSGLPKAKANSVTASNDSHLQGATAMNDPAKEADDEEMVEANRQPAEHGSGADAEPEKARPSASNRKRSTELAGLPETAEGGRSRSKRIRTRESITEGGNTTDAATISQAKQALDQQLAYIHADEWLFEVVGGQLRKLELDDLGSPETLRDTLLTEPKEGTEGHTDVPLAATDLYEALRVCTDDKARILIHEDGSDGVGGKTKETGFQAFLGQLKPAASSTRNIYAFSNEAELLKLSEEVNGDWSFTKEVAWSFLEHLLKPRALTSSTSTSQELGQSSYISDPWPKELKRVVVQLVVNLDEYIFAKFFDKVAWLTSRALELTSKDRKFDLSVEDITMIETAQTLFEIHLDICSLIRQRGSGVEVVIQALQKDRLERWSLLVGDIMNLYFQAQKESDSDMLSLRYAWASVLHLSLHANVPREHVIACIKDLKPYVSLAVDTAVYVANNAVMPEISLEAADRELMKLSLKDFFGKIFDESNKDPVTLIENLEPILEPGLREPTTPVINGDADQAQSSSVFDDTKIERSDERVQPPSPLSELIKFVEESDISLRLALWDRLRTAYEAIEYPPKVVSCCLRSVEIIMGQVKVAAYLNAPLEQRQFLLLKYLRIANQLLLSILNISKDRKVKILECIDYDHLKTSLTAVTDLIRILHAFNIFDDSVRVGKPGSSTATPQTLMSFPMIRKTLQELQVRGWILLYFLMREAMVQNPNLFPAPSEERLSFLRSVHNAMGLRGLCKATNMGFLKMAKDELLQLTDVDYCDSELSQVLYDLYGLKCFISSAECFDHETTPEPLDRKSALQLVGFLVSQAHKVSLKELHKTELKTAIEKVHTVVGRSKINEDIIRNKKLYLAFLRSPINPLSLFRCLQGIGTLSTRTISAKQSVIASKGWYFLQGQIALNRFRSQKRLVPGSLEDLNAATTFFAQDLEYSTEKWETWYRAAQAYDSLIEENVSWSAEKLNNNSNDLIQHQRSAIHCYTMATACAVRHNDNSAEIPYNMAEMYFDFGMRVYASSRQPFSMEAFRFKESEKRHFSGGEMYVGQPFSELRLYTAWKFASALFRRGLRGRPDHWMGHYMLGKCIWKMHSADSTIRGNGFAPDTQTVIKALVQAIEKLPEKKDNRRDPILEPHYKLVSVVHKLVQHGKLQAKEACEALQATPYARKIPSLIDSEDLEWEEYILRVLKSLRTADKSGWHHRMVARAAHIIYDDSSTDLAAAMGAKHELTQQMFTKTMTVQVWKPEFERPGRHFVYTSRYLLFFAQLLAQVGDRPNLEMLARKVRKKTHEYYEHSLVWSELCSYYLKVLRRAGRVPEGHEDAIFKGMSYDEFTAKSASLETWCQKEGNSSLLIEVLRDTIELKKLNAGLMKPIPIDDLIADTYALIYEQIGPELEQPDPESRSGASNERPNRMALNNLMNMDGAADSPGPEMASESAQTQPDQPLRQRVKSVNRREIQRKAEAAVNKPAPAAIPIRPSPRAGDPSVLVVIEPRVSEKQEPGAAVESSVPGSVHDSADDESELSELDEPIIIKPLFPGLQKTHAHEDSVTASNRDDSELDEILKDEDTEQGA